MSGEAKRSRSPRDLIERIRRDGDFVYRRHGRTIRDAQSLERIAKLAIPPAWQQVEISASSTGKVQARGIDAAGRRQAIYHQQFRNRQERAKFARLAEFGSHLPALRTQLRRDLRRTGLPEEKVLAALIRLIDLHLLRLGNPRYTAEYASFGAITLRRRHANFSAHAVDFAFVGKSGQPKQLQVRDAELLAVLRELEQQPGHEFFRIHNGAGKYRLVRGEQVNAYLHEYLGPEFSAKDFRTFGGTRIALDYLLKSDLHAESSHREQQRAQRQAVQAAAEVLGNTAATARRSYTSPTVLQVAEDPRTLIELRSWGEQRRERILQPVSEQCLVHLLQQG